MLKMITRSFFIALILALSGCGITSKVTFENSSLEALSNVKIYASESLIWQGDLEAGKSISVSFNVDRDGALRVIGNGNSKAFDTDYLGYTTPNDGIYHTVTYEGKSVTSYDYSSQE